MRFRKKETAQDVVVCCCILHNMRKIIDTPEKEYSEIACLFQNELSEHFNERPQPHLIILQDFIMQNYFH